MQDGLFSTNYTTDNGGIDTIFKTKPIEQFAEHGPITSDIPRISRVDTTLAQKYLGTSIFDTDNLEEQIAKKQSWGAKFAGFLGQSLGEIVGGSLEGFGSIYQIIEDTISEANNGDADFTNLLIDVGRGIREGSKDLLPIYRENPDKAFDLDDWGWWFENGTSLASTLSLLIPAAGTVRGLGYLGKLAGVADKVGDTAKLFGKIGTTAAIMRNGENMRESFEVLKSVKSDTLNQLSSGDNFDKWLLTDAGQEYLQEIGGRDISIENASDWIASKSAWHSYKWNSANIVFDLVQAATLFRGVGKLTRTNILGGKETVRTASGLETGLAKRAAKTFHPVLGTFAGQFTEGIEEAVNFIGGEEGKYYGKLLANNRPDNKDLPERLEGYVSDPMLWNSFAWGIAGGAAFQAVSNVASRKNRRALEINKLAEINNRSQLIASFSKQKQDLIDSYNKKEISNDDLKAGIDDITSTLGYHLGLTAAKNGNVDNLIEVLDNPDFQSKIASSYSAEELKNLEISQDELITDVKKNVLLAEENYRKFNRYLFASNASQAAKDSLLTTQLMTVGEVNRHQKAVERLTDKYNELIKEESEINPVTKDINFNTTLDLAGVSLALRLLQKQAKSGTFPARVQEKINGEVERLAQEKSRLTEALKLTEKADLENINSELIDTVAALNLRKAFKGVNENLLVDLKKKGLVNEIDADLDKRKREEEKLDLEELENDLQVKIVNKSLTEKELDDLAKSENWKNNRKAQGIIGKAKANLKEKEKADKIKTETTPVQSETDTENPLAQVVVTEGIAIDQAISKVVPEKNIDLVLEAKKELPGTFDRFNAALDNATTIEALQNFRDKTLNTRKLKLNENSAATKLIDEKITNLQEKESVDNSDITVADVLIEEIIPVEENVNIESVVENTEVEKVEIVQETIKEPEQVIEETKIGSANLFVLPLSFIGKIENGYKIQEENDDEARMIYNGDVSGSVELKVSVSNPKHKNTIEESAIEIFKDGKATKIFLNTIPSIQVQIDVVNKIREKLNKGEELKEDVYYPEIKRKINEIEWIKESWYNTLHSNLENTIKIRKDVFENQDKIYTANLSINSPGSIVNSRKEDGSSNWVKFNKTFDSNTELFFTPPEIAGGSLELIGTNGNRIAQRTSNVEFNPGRIYTGIKGLNGDVIPARLKVNVLSTQDINKAYILFFKLAEALQSNKRLDSREVNEIRDKINEVLVVNKFNDDANTYLKIHQNRIEMSFGENKEHTLHLNYRFPVKGKGFVNIKTKGLNDVLARFIVKGQEQPLEVFYQKDKNKFEKAVKKALGQKLYNVDKKKLLSDGEYRTEVIENRLLTDIGGVFDSKGELLGRVILKQENRIENAIFSINNFKEGRQEKEDIVSITEGSEPKEVQPSIDNDFSDILLSPVSDVNTKFEISTLEERKENWKKMFGDNVEFDGNIAELIWAKGQWAYGVFRNAMVQVSQLAPKGTEYHEAFHVVSHLYLNEKQYQGILKEKRNSNQEFKDKTDLEIEELLANDFHLYSLMKEQNREYKGITGNIKKFFDKLYNYIKNVLGYPTDYIFDKIYSGGFNYKPSDTVLNFTKNHPQELLSATPTDVELSFTRRDIDTFVNILTRFSGEFYLRNQNLKKEDIISDSQNNVKTFVKNLVEDISNNPSKWGTTENQSKELKRRLNYFDEFWNITKQNLDRKLNIELDYDDSINVSELDERLKKDWDDTKAFSRSAKETFSTELKLLIMTIPQIANFVEGKPVTAKDAELGIATALDFNKVYPYLQRAMTGSLDLDEMMSRLKTLSSHDPSLLYLKQKLDDNPNLKRAFFFNFNKPLNQFHNYQVTPINDEITVKFDISNTATTHFKLSNVWSENIKTKIDLGYYTKENKEQSKNLLHQLNMAENNGDIDSLSDLSSQLFELVGIRISSDVIKKMITNELNIRYHNGSIPSYREIIKIPLTNLAKRLYPDNGEPKFDNLGDLNSIALQYQFYTYEGQENSFANTDGSIMFGFNNPNFISNFFKQIKAVVNPHYNNIAQARENLLNVLKEYARDPSMKYSNWMWNTGNGGFLNLVDGKKSVDGLTVSHINYSFLRNIALFNFDGVKNRITGDGQRYSNMSDEDWKLTEILDYLSVDRKNHDYIGIPIVGQADSGNSGTVKVSNFQYKSDNDLRLNGFIFEAVKNTVRQEILRMKFASDLMFKKNADGTLEVKDGLEIDKLQNLYHYKLDKNGNPLLLDKDGRPTGNVFKFQNMLIKSVDENGLPIVRTLNDIDELFLHGVINLQPGNVLVPSQVQAVDNFVSDFIQYEIQETKKNFGRLEPTLAKMKDANGKSMLAVYNNEFDKFIAEFAMNHYIANVEMGNFFNGNIAEYKSAIDTNKRAKELTSPIISGDLEILGDIYNGIILNDIKLQSKSIGNIILGLEKEFKKQNKDFRNLDVEVNNIISGKSDNELETKILSIIKPYLSINTTDAQGYMTWNRYKKVIKSFGREFSDILELIDRIDRNETINPLEYNRLITPNKPYSYGRYFDNYTGRMMSRQIKYSAFPLIPNLIKGTDLERLNDWAVSNNVDEIYFESAIKVGASDITKISDDNGGLIKDFASKLNPQPFFNRFWGLQLDVIQHTMDEENKFGVQLAKIVPSGLSKDKVYNLDGDKVSGDTIKKEWHEVLAAHIEEEANNLLKQLKAVKKDGVWTIDSNSKEIQEILFKELKRRNLAQNYSDAIEYNIRGEFNLPLFYSAMANKFESLLSSLFKNNVTDISMPGSHLVLGSTAFLTKANQDTTGIEWSQEIIDRKDYGLRTIQYNKDGNIVAEALMPRWTKKFFKDGQPININELPDEVRTFIMNRIPTESKHSIIVLKAVGFLPSELDALMIVPDEVVPMMGSDFDVDSGYNWHYNLETIEDKIQTIKYDTSKSAKENGKKARENRLLDLSISVMLSPNTFIENVTTSSFEDMTKSKEDLQSIRSIDERNINPNSVNGQLFFRSTNIAGRALKGLAASYNGILPVFQDVGAKFISSKEDNTGFIVKYDKKDLNIKEIKSRYGKDVIEETDNTVTINHRYIGNSPSDDFLNIDGKHLTTYSSQTLSNVLDIVKEGVPLNFNTYTFGVFQSLLAVGSNVEYASRLIDQPIINHLFKQVQSNEGLLDNNNMSPITKTRNLYQTELFKTLYYLGKYKDSKEGKKHVKFLSKNTEQGIVWNTERSIFVPLSEVEDILGYNPNTTVLFTKSELEKNIEYSVKRKDRTSKLSSLELKKQAEYLTKQLQVLNLFSIYRENANEISEAMRLLSFDKTASSPNLNITSTYQNKLDSNKVVNIIDVNDKNIIEGVYSDNSTYPVLKAYWEFSNKLSFEVFGNLFIKYSPSFTNATNQLVQKIDSVNDNTIKKFHDYLLSLNMTKIQFLSDIDRNKTLGIDRDIQVQDTISIDEFKNLSVANKVFIAKSKYFKLLYENPNHILNYLEGKLSKDNIDRTGFHKIEMNKAAPSEGIDDYISDSIRDMYFGTDLFLKDLAEDLIRYSFSVNGMNFGKDSFSNYIPEFVLNQVMDTGNELRNIHKRNIEDEHYISKEFENYLDLFIKNNWYNKDIVPRVATRFKKIEGELVEDEARTQAVGEVQYKTEKNTPVWELTGDFLVVPYKQMEREDRSVRNSKYVLLNQRIGDTIQKILMKRDDSNIVQVSEKEYTGEYYYYPINKLGNIHLKNEFTENSVLQDNNVAIPESVYENYFNNLKDDGVSWDKIKDDFYKKEREQQSNNNNIDCK